MCASSAARRRERVEDELGRRAAIHQGGSAGRQHDAAGQQRDQEEADEAPQQLVEDDLERVQAGPRRQQPVAERHRRPQPAVHHADLAPQLGAALLGRGHEHERLLVEGQPAAVLDDLARDQEVVGARRSASRAVKKLRRTA